ncbi:MAG: hypothetical protein HG456_004310 [candidate division SR1 bacterium]|nr:hypothetical protein [candidate division SR1 bacterium]
MIKKGLCSILIAISMILPLFAIEVRLPQDSSQSKNDLSINTEKNNNNGVINSSQSKKDSTIFSVINLINKYLWRSFGVIAMGLTAYAGYEAINSGGDTKSLKKAMRIFIGIAVGLAIAMLSSALIKIVVNLI